jgi:hypothetical protein
MSDHHLRYLMEHAEELVPVLYDQRPAAGSAEIPLEEG